MKSLLLFLSVLSPPILAASFVAWVFVGLAMLLVELFA
jgi:hypothetical protein